eukprot:m.75430 g.75430  ORF g.75430 m.75430 type:complete len:574 (-) comp7817_c0_seq2:3372-5093(-)
MIGTARQSRLAKELVLVFLGRKTDNWRILKVVGVTMAIIYWLKSGSAPKPMAASLREVLPPENYYGTNGHQMHGYLGHLPNGQPTWLPREAPEPPADLLPELRDNGFYIKLSDSISLDRNVTDFRDPLCHHQKYDIGSLYQTSVVFVFHNEALSTLLRSIHSVLNRTPPRLLREIILVDDASTREYLGKELEYHIKYLPKVRIVRLPKRSGLVIARLAGIEAAQAETFTILDSHIEVQPGWLEPMMQRITESPTTVVMPIIDTFQFTNQGIGCTLGFLWSLVEHSIDIQAKDQAIRKSSVDPVRSPTMAGGLFAAHKSFFDKLGGYDREWGFWGAENLELSFRLWQCGGSLECMPCSRVYHIFRNGGVPYSAPSEHLPRNRLRTAAIWMDEYADIVRGTVDRSIDVGPIQRMQKLRTDLQCRNFSWFLHNVYPESLIVEIEDVIAYDTVYNPGTQMCLTAEYAGAGDVTTLESCTDGRVGQRFLLHRNGQLRPASDLELCLKSDLSVVICEWNQHNGIVWTRDASGNLRNLGTQKCLTASNDGPKVQTCGNDKSQIWKFTPYQPQSPRTSRVL